MAAPELDLNAVFDAAMARERAARAAKAIADAEAAAAAAAERERTRSRTAGEVAQDAGAQLLQGAVGLGQSAYGLANFSSAGLFDRLTGMSENFQDTNQILQGAKSSPTQVQSAEAQRVFDEEGVLAGIGETVTSLPLMQDLLVPNILSMMPTAAASRYAGQTALRTATAPGASLTDDAIAKLVADRSTTAAVRAAGAQSLGSTNVEAINRARDAGASEGDAQLAGLGGGAIAGVLTPALSRVTGAGRLEAAVANRIFGGPATGGNVGSSVVRGAISGAAREGIEETAQSAGEQAATNVFAPGVDVLEGVPQAAALGGIAGTGLGTGMGAYSSAGSSPRRETPLRQQIEQTIATQAADSGVTINRPLAPAMDLQAAIDSQVRTPSTGITEADLLSAQDVDATRRAAEVRSVAEILFNTETAPDGTVSYAQFDPDLQVMQPVPEAQALLAAEQAIAESEAQNQPAGLPQVEEVESIEGAPAPDFTDPIPLPQVEELGVENIDLTELPATPPARTAAPAVPSEQLQAFINARTGVDRELNSRDRATAEDYALMSLYNVDTDPATGAQVYTKYNPELQRLDVVPAAVAKREAKRVIKEEQARAAAEAKEAAQPPIVGWRSRLVKELGVSPRNLQGKEWSQFAAAVEASGIRADDPAASKFLSDMVPVLNADPATAGKFAATLSEKYAPVPDVADVAAQASADVPTPDAPKVEAVAQAAETTVAAPAAEVVAPNAQPGDVVPTNVAPDVAVNEVSDVKKASINLQRKARTIEGKGPVQMYGAIEDTMYNAHTATELDELFGLIKHTPEFKGLPAELQDLAVSVYSDLYDEMESVGRFKTDVGGAPKSALSAAEFNALLVTARNNPRGTPVVGHQNAAEYRKYTGRQAPNNIQGVYSEDGTVHMVRSNIPDKASFGLVLAHEMGHGGLRGLLGQRLAPAINRMHANAAVRKRIAAKEKQLPGISRLTAGEEVLADMIANNEQITGDVWSKLKSAVAQTTARVLGVGDLRVSDSDVDALLTSTVAYIRGHEINKLPKLADSLQNVSLDAIVGDPAALMESAVYSRAISELETLVEGIPRDEGQPTTTIGHISERATNTARKAVGAMTGPGSTKVFRGVLAAVPLAQINNLYSKHFDTGGTNHLTEVVQEVRRHGAKHNQLLTRARKITYGTESFNAAPLEIAREWENLGKKDRPAFEALNTLQQYATLYNLWPDRTMAQQSDVDYDAVGYTIEERTKAHKLIQTLWARTGAEGQAVFKKSQADFKAQWGARYESLAKELSRTTGIPRTNPDGTPNREFQQKYGDTIDSALNRIQSGPYSPLTRYGDYFTVVRDAEGNLLEFHGSDTLVEAQQKAASFRGGVDDKNREIFVNTAVRDEFIRTLDGINHDVLDKFEEGVKASMPADMDPAVTSELIKGLREAYLQSLPKHSIMQHANQRKGVQGFTLDAFRAYNDYTIKSAKATADYDHNGNISRGLLGMANQVREAGKTAQNSDTTTMGQILQAVKSQRDAYLKAERSPAAEWLGQAGYIQYLTSPSHMVINAMQTVMVAVPRMAARFNSMGALRETKNGLNVFLKSRGDMLGPNSTLDADTKRVLGRLQENGVLDFTQAHDMTDLADGGLNHMSGHWRAAMEVMSFAVHKSEVFNRQVTAYAAAKLAIAEARKEAGMSETATLSDAQLERVAQIAEQVTYDSHYDYSASNRPQIMQGPYRKLLFQFQSYRLNTLAMMYKDFRDSLFTKGLSKAEVESARRGLAWLLGTQLAFTGAAGTIMAPLVFSLLDMFRDDEDLLDSRTEFLRSAPPLLAHGVMSGVLDLGRIDSGSLLPYFGEKAYAPKDASATETVMYHLQRNLGPWLGLVTAWSEFGSKVAEGDVVKAMEVGLPKVFADPIKAVSGYNGVEDARGVTYFDPDGWSTVAQAVGLRSGGRREAEELRGASYQLAKRVSTVKSRYLGRVALGITTGDTDMVQSAYADIANWNSTYPDMAIGARDVSRAISTRYKTQVMTDLFGVPTGRPLTESAIEALNLNR